MTVSLVDCSGVALKGATRLLKGIYYSGKKILQPSVIPAKAGIQYFLNTLEQDYLIFSKRLLSTDSV